MLGTWLFVAFWLLLGVSVFFIAVRGGLGGARATFQSQTYGARRAAGIGFTVLYVAFGIAIPLVLLIGNHSNASAQYAGIQLTQAERPDASCSVSTAACATHWPRPMRSARWDPTST